MKRRHKLSIVYIVILLTGLSLWQLWKSSRIIEDPAYTVTTQQYSFLLFPLFVGIQMWFKSHREKICYLFINQLISYLFICLCQTFFVPLHL